MSKQDTEEETSETDGGRAERLEDILPYLRPQPSRDSEDVHLDRLNRNRTDFKVDSCLSLF